MISLLPHIKDLHCLSIPHEPQHLSPLFDNHPRLQYLSLSLYTPQAVTELFTILQTNSSLKGLEVMIKTKAFNNSAGDALKNMLIKNQTLKYFEIDIEDPISISFFIKNGLMFNNTLQELWIPILLPINDDTQNLFDHVICQKHNITDLKLFFKTSHSSTTNSTEEMMAVSFYDQGLPLLTNMLQSHPTIRLLMIEYSEHFNQVPPQSNWTEIVQHFYENISIHPSVEYVGITILYSQTNLMEDIFKAQQEALMDLHKQAQLTRPLPIAEFYSY